MMSNLVKKQPDNPWVKYGDLGIKYNPINMCKGFPDYPPPQHVVEALITASKSPLSHQYTHQYGHPRLVSILSQLYGQLLSRSIDPMKEILITIGAYEALLSVFLGLINSGDEVIVIEPFYDCYPPMIEMAGGVAIYVPLNPPKDAGERAVSSAEWTIDFNELTSKFNERTKIIVITNPNNPSGKVFSEEELTQIGKLCRQYGVIALMDEVYEWVIYEGSSHVRMASLPEMWPYTLTVGSIGKTFNVTGWKIGWIYGPQHLIAPLQKLHSHTVHHCPTPLQEASAIALEIEFKRLDSPQSFWKRSLIELQVKRELLVTYLKSSGINPTVPQGGYFIVANHRNIKWPSWRVKYNDEQMSIDGFAEWLCIEKRLLTIPISYFYSDGNRKRSGKDLIRFCFFKKDSTIHEAGKVLRQLECKLQSQL